jgi:hypothetical protein
MENPDKESPIHEAHAACFDSRMEDRKSGAPDRCGRLSSGRSRKIACPGCRRQRHSSGACECARAERLGQRSQRHRQRGQGACDIAADNNAGYAARRIPFDQLPRAAGAASGKDQTDAICRIQIASRAAPSGRQAARQAARRQHTKHLQGMLSSATGFRTITNASEYWIPRSKFGLRRLARYAGLVPGIHALAAATRRIERSRDGSPRRSRLQGHRAQPEWRG